MVKLTTAQFAKLHHVNKRTLHYYDNIGLFSPLQKGENGYRYYDLSQSVSFEYLRMLKELNMSIDEIADYWRHPSDDQFIALATTKERELEAEIQRLKQTKKILKAKKEQLMLCKTLTTSDIRMEWCEEEKLLTLPYDVLDDDIPRLFSKLQDQWTIEQIRMGVGSFISIDQVENHQFDAYDGIFTYSLGKTYDCLKPEGWYLCGYQKGPWNTAPEMYEALLAYANKHQLKLTGHAYEIGLNEFAITSKDDYITKFMIKVEHYAPQP